MSKGDEESIEIHIVVNGYDMPFAVFWRAVIAILAVAAFGDAQRKFILCNPTGTGVEGGGGNVFGEGGSYLFDGHAMRLKMLSAKVNRS